MIIDTDKIELAHDKVSRIAEANALACAVAMASSLNKSAVGWNIAYVTSLSLMGYTIVGSDDQNWTLDGFPAPEPALEKWRFPGNSRIVCKE